MSDEPENGGLTAETINRQRLLRRLGAGAAALLLSAVLASSGRAGAAASEAQAQEIDQITWGVQANIRGLFMPKTFDVQTSLVSASALESLLTTESDGSLKPRLAESWKQTDPVTYVYKVRRGVKFWDGSPMTAEDVAFSMAWNLDPKNASAVNFFYSAVKSIRATGPFEVTIKLKAPDATFQYIPAMAHASPVISKRFLEQHGKDIGTPGALLMGTGPYQITEYVPDQRVTLVRNESYWGPKPAVKKAILRFITDDATRLLALRSGELDGTFQLPIALAEQLGRAPGVKVLYWPSMRVATFSFNTQSDPWNDIHVRRAIAYALDKKGLVKAILRGQGQPANAIPAPEQWGGLLPKAKVRRFYATLPQYQFDLNKARAEIAKSRHPKGFEATVPYSSGFPQMGKAALNLAQQLKKIGITLHVQEKTAERWRADLLAWKKKKPGMVAWLIFVDYPDPSNNPQYILASKYAGWPNPAFYKNPRVDRLLDEQLRTPNPRKRAQLIQQVLRTAQAELPYLPLWWENDAMAIRDRYTYAGPSAWYFFQPWLTKIGSG